MLKSIVALKSIFMIACISGLRGRPGGQPVECGTAVECSAKINEIVAFAFWPGPQNPIFFRLRRALKGASPSPGKVLK